MHLIEDESKLRAIIQEKSMTAVLFSDAACNVCLSIYPELEALEKVYPEMYFVTVDVAKMQKVVGEHLIFVYPTLIVFAMGKETKRFERVFSMQDVESGIQRYYDMIFS
ncbi:MAG: hypothetical protein PWQ12_2164 [Clostridiales bacterium]|nr:hypothetical protein [Clostridiales bacterium]